MNTVHDSGGDLDDAAEYLGIGPQLVRAAVDYYADFPDEIDEDAVVAREIEADERARWQRRPQSFAGA